MNEVLTGQNLDGERIPAWVARLVAGFVRGTLHAEEHALLDEWVEADERHMRLFEWITEETKKGKS